MSLLLDVLTGVCTSASTLFIVQPFYALKTARQNQYKLIITPQVLWGGYLSNVVGDSTNFSAQYLVFKNKESMIFHHALVGGLIGGCIANFSEQLMDRHRFFVQNNQSTHYTQTVSILLKEKGLSIFKRGLLATCLREITYNYAWSVGIHELDKRMSQIIPNPIISKLASSSLAGCMLTAINHPFDTLKSKIHNECQSGYLRADGLKQIKKDLKSHSIQKITKSLLLESYSGAAHRAMIISLTLLFTQPLIELYSKAFKTPPFSS
jgi:hypothetical protein